MGQESYLEDEVVYQIGERPDKFYFLIKGELTLETEIEIEDVNQFPIVSLSI
jgi:hypothetical protein